MRTAEDIPTTALPGTDLAASKYRATAERNDMHELHCHLQRLLRLVHRLTRRVDDPHRGLVATRRHADRQLTDLHHRCDTLAARVDDLEDEHAATRRRAAQAEADRDTYARLWARLHADLDELRAVSRIGSSA
jgi:DNA repair ATPase RecN